MSDDEQMSVCETSPEPPKTCIIDGFEIEVIDKTKQAGLNRDNVKLPPPWTCEKCGHELQYSRNFEIERHLKTHLPRSEREFKCLWPGCVFASTQGSNLDRHINDTHLASPEEKRHKCLVIENNHICSSAFRDQSSLTRHRKAVHGFPSRQDLRDGVVFEYSLAAAPPPSRDSEKQDGGKSIEPDKAKKAVSTPSLPPVTIIMERQDQAPPPPTSFQPVRLQYASVLTPQAMSSSPLWLERSYSFPSPSPASSSSFAEPVSAARSRSSFGSFSSSPRMSPYPLPTYFHPSTLADRGRLSFERSCTYAARPPSLLVSRGNVSPSGDSQCTYAFQPPRLLTDQDSISSYRTSQCRYSFCPPSSTVDHTPEDPQYTVHHAYIAKATSAADSAITPRLNRMVEWD